MLCDEAGTSEAVWDCGLDGRSNVESGFVRGPVCRGTAYPLYGYNGFYNGLEKLKLPEGTGVQVGAGSGYQAIVLGTHFPELRNLTNGMTGNTNVSITLLTTARGLEKVGDITMSSWGFIPPHSQSSVGGCFTLDEDIVIRPFATSVHTHVHGLSATLVKRDRNGSETLLLQQDPKTDKYYHMIESGVTLRAGDKFVFSCEFKNSGSEILTVL